MGEEKELMKRQNILLIVFAVLLAAAACVYFFVIRPAVADTGNADTAEPAETEEGENLSSSGSIFMFTGMSREDVEYIKVDNAYGTFKFTASGTDGTDFVIDGYDNVPYSKDLLRAFLMLRRTRFQKRRWARPFPTQSLRNTDLPNHRQAGRCFPNPDRRTAFSWVTGC